MLTSAHPFSAPAVAAPIVRKRWNLKSLTWLRLAHNFLISAPSWSTASLPWMFPEMDGKKNRRRRGGRKRKKAGVVLQPGRAQPRHVAQTRNMPIRDNWTSTPCTSISRRSVYRLRWLAPDEQASLDELRIVSCLKPPGPIAPDLCLNRAGRSGS